MRLILLLSCYFVSIIVNGQSYVPMLDDRNEWQLGYCDENGCYKDIYYTDGDTVAFGHQYKILDGYHYISRKFLLREEVEQKKVFMSITYNGQTTEYELYDFGLEEGDSIRMLNPISPFPPDMGYFKVDSIRYKPILENRNGKFFYFSATESNEEGFGYLPVWVEGVGSLSLINAPGGEPQYYGAGHLSCFWKNQDLYYHDEQMGMECESVLNSSEPDLSEVRFAVSRQKKGILTHAEKVSRIAVYDTSGRMLKEIHPKQGRLVEIDLSGLDKGIYFLRYLEQRKWRQTSFVIR